MNFKKISIIVITIISIFSFNNKVDADHQPLTCYYEDTASTAQSKYYSYMIIQDEKGNQKYFYGYNTGQIYSSVWYIAAYKLAGQNPVEILEQELSKFNSAEDYDKRAEGKIRFENLTNDTYFDECPKYIIGKHATNTRFTPPYTIYLKFTDNENDQIKNENATGFDIKNKLTKEKDDYSYVTYFRTANVYKVNNDKSKDYNDLIIEDDEGLNKSVNKGVLKNGNQKAQEDDFIHQCIYGINATQTKYQVTFKAIAEKFGYADTADSKNKWHLIQIDFNRHVSRISASPLYEIYLTPYQLNSEKTDPIDGNYIYSDLTYSSMKSATDDFKTCPQTMYMNYIDDELRIATEKNNKYAYIEMDLKNGEDTSGNRIKNEENRQIKAKEMDKAMEIIEISSCEDIINEDLAKYLKFGITLLRISVPIIIIVMTIVEMSRNIFAGEDEMKKAQGKIIRRLIIAAAFFLVPTLLKLLLDIATFIWPTIDSSLCGIF